MDSGICIVAINVAFGNASQLQRELDCNIAIQQNESKGYGSLLTRQPFSLNDIPKSRHYIFVGAGVLTRVDLSSLDSRKTVVITDSHYLREKHIIDGLISKHNIEVFCMADLWSYCSFDKKMYVHPFSDISPCDKSEDLIISHSPYSHFKMKLKGSNGIRKAVDLVRERYPDIKYDCILGLEWKDCLKRKSQSHIFIDQLCVGTHADDYSYQGGIGKSGLEAMLMKSLTFASGNPVESDIPKNPYVSVSSIQELSESLIHFINNPIEMERKIEEQYNWARKYTNPSLVVKRLIE